MPTPFKHAALIKQLADDTSLAIWYWHRGHKAWFTGTPELLFDSDEIMAVGDKPTDPPPRMCTLAGIEFPAPLTVAPEVGTTFYFASMYRGKTSPSPLNWRGDSIGQQALLELGVVHLTREGAELHSDALIAANKLAIAEDAE